MSKRKSNIIITIVCLLLCATAVTLTRVQQDRVEQANRPLTPFQQQAMTFAEGYDRQLGRPETKDEMIKVLKAAQILCAYLDEDPDLKYAFTYGTDKLDMSSDQTVVVIEQGIHAFCPRHTPLLQAGE